MSDDLEERIFSSAAKAWLTWAVVFILVLVYAYSAGLSFQRMVFGPIPATLKNFGALDSQLIDGGDWTRLIRSLCLHGDLLHLSFNALALVVLGRIGEGIYGPWRFFFLLLVSGICGSVLSWAMGASNTVGASGAIFGLLGALVIYGWKQRSELDSELGQALRKKLAFWGGLNLAVGFAIPFVDNAAHCGGLIGGLLMGMILGGRQ